MTFLEWLQMTWKPRLFSLSQSLAQCLAHGIMYLHRFTDECAREKNNFLLKLYCLSPSPPISQLWKSLNMLFVVLHRLHLNWACRYHILLAIPHTSPVRLALLSALSRRGHGEVKEAICPGWIAQGASGRRGICVPRSHRPACLASPQSPLALNLIMKCGFSVLHFENHVKGINS